jgi:hypothetical protein
MKFRAAALAAVLVCGATIAQAQTPLRLQISGGRVTLHAENVPARTILDEWARLGGAKIVNGDRIAGAPLTLELEGVPERQALDIILRGVSGYVLAAREAGAAGASIYDRIMILPTSAAPRNPPPQAAPVFNGAGIVRPIGRDDDSSIDTDQQQLNDGVPLGRPVPFPRPVGAPVGSPFNPPMTPPITLQPDDQPQPPQPAPGVVATPTNPFGLPPGSSVRPGVITPAVPPQTPQSVLPPPSQD